MQKLSFSFLAMAGLLCLASCANDDPAVTGNPGEVTFSVVIPEDLNTRAAGEAIEISELTYAIYAQNPDGSAGDLYITKTIPMTNGTAVVNEKILPGKEFFAAFWASASDAPYKFNAEDKTLTVVTDELVASSEAGDGFYNTLANIKSVAGSYSNSVILTRPFAQINLGTDDLPDIEKLGINTENLECALTVQGAYTTMDLITGQVSNEVNGDNKLTFKSAPCPTYEVYPQPEYTYVSYAYVLINDKTTLTVGYETNNVELPTASWDFVPAERNKRSNIYGSLFTNPVNINVSLDSEWGGNYQKFIDGAVVKLNDNGVVECIVSALPPGVTEDDLEGHGGVAITPAGDPVYFEATSSSVNSVLQSGVTEIYFTKNATITTKSHQLVVPTGGVTVHGNGASFSGEEMDFSIQESNNYKYTPGSTVDINISNLNNVKIWGGPTTACTFNINMNMCTMKGTGIADSSHSLVMTRGGSDAVININLNDCYCQEVQDGIHSTYLGTISFNNLTFKNVGVPINIAKKSVGAMDIDVIGCKFIDCGIPETETTISAWNYAAPIRIVDNGGPADSINLTISNCKITGRLGLYDVLLMDYRSDKTWFPIKYSIKNSGDLTVQATALN